MSSLEKLYPKIEKKETVKEIYHEFKAEPVKNVKHKKEPLYPPTGEEFNYKYIIEHKPPKKVVIEYLKKRSDELVDTDSD